MARSGPVERTRRSRIIRYHSIVRGDAPSAALAARNSSTARPSVKRPRESDAHRSGCAESGAQRSVESGAQTIVRPPGRPMSGPRQATRCSGSTLRDHRILCNWLARKDSNLQSPDPESGALPLGHSPAVPAGSSSLAQRCPPAQFAVTRRARPKPPNRLPAPSLPAGTSPASRHSRTDCARPGGPTAPAGSG